MKLKDLFEEQLLVEMPTMLPKDTGIEGVSVWVGGDGDKLQHGPRIKVSLGNGFNKRDNSTITLADKPRIIGNTNISQDQFAEITKWMFTNRELLMQLHHNQIDGKQFKELAKPITDNEY